MAKRTSSGPLSPPKPPKLTLPKPSKRPAVPKPPSLQMGRIALRPYYPKPENPRLPERFLPPKPPRLDFPKPYTSDTLTVIPQTSRPRLAMASAGPAAAKSAAMSPAAEAVGAVVAAPVKTVLWTSAYPALRETTKLMLEGQGFEVHSASDFLQVEAACRDDKFQLAIVDHTLAPKIKRAIAAVIRQKRPATLILELCQVSSEIPDTDYVLIGHDPDALVQMVLRIARERNLKR